MKIGIVTTWFERGAAYVSRQFRTVLEQSGHEVFVFARGEEDKSAAAGPEWNGPRVFRARRTLAADASGVSFGQFRRWLRETGVEAVLFNEQRTPGPVAICNGLGVRTVAYVDYYTKETVRDFAIYDALICNTKRHASVFSWHPRCLFVPWGTDTELFKPSGRWPELVEPGFVTFFHSAGFSPQRKGTDLLVRAFDKVRSPARLVVHAQRDLRRAVPDVAPIVERLVSAGRLKLVERSIPAPGAYHMGDVYVYPSRLDGIGLTVCEALACGLPVVVSDEPPMNEFAAAGCSELVPVDRREPRWDGYYWPMCHVDVDALAETLEALASAPERIPEKRRRAREYALGDRSWAENAKILLPFFADLARAHDEAFSRRFARRPFSRFCRDVFENAKLTLKRNLSSMKGP